mmetsp:Transcript_108095/g.187577  ORF Transcript_108095/g.187577 Transcript_108095/m.187577 type:complete len:629 (+) Transcript_108095:61-1947(+)
MASADATVKAINDACQSIGGVYAGYSCKSVSWDDVARNTVNGNLSCHGANITDTRLWAKDGRQLFTVRSDNWNEKLGSVSAGDVAIVAGSDAASVDGGLQTLTLRDVLATLGSLGQYAGLPEATDMSNQALDAKVSIRFQTTFLPVSAEESATLEFCTEAYNYTSSEEDPRNLILFCTSQGLAVQQDGLGAKRLFHHVVDDRGVIHRHWLEVEKSSHRVGGPQRETAEERAAAASRGKATSSMIGVRAMGTRFNVLMTVQVPLQQGLQVQMLPTSSYAISSVDELNELIARQSVVAVSVPDSHERSKVLYMAKLAEQAERYEDMSYHMCRLCFGRDDFSMTERNLLSVAYKNVVGSRRATWRLLTSEAQKESKHGKLAKGASTGEYCIKVRDEALKICVEVLHLLENQLLPKASTNESKIFYLKMKADYQRYMTEFTGAEAKVKMASETQATYEEALALAKKALATSHPIRLGLALNMSVFFQEVLGDQQAASDLARSAFEDSIAELDNCSEDSYKDSTLIMQLLRDNLTGWTAAPVPVGTACAARVSKGSEFDVWDGLTVKAPQRHASEHVTCTVVIYNMISGGVPSQEDVVAAIDDLKNLYASCTDSGCLNEYQFDFMKEEIADNA